MGIAEMATAETVDDKDMLLAIRGLTVDFRTQAGVVHAVRGIDLDVRPGETLAIVGESGSGKSQTMMAAMGLIASNGSVAGSVRYRGRELVGASSATLNQIRGSRVTMIFQEPMTSLDPLVRVGDQIALPLTYHGGMSKAEARKRAVELLSLVKIPDPTRRVKSFPHEMSGGQRQRVMIAMALALKPDLLIADEPTTALDVTIQAEILALMAELKQQLGMGLVFITHDLGLVRRIADRVAVMRAGEIVELGPVGEVFAQPKADYTRMLLAAEPKGVKPPPPEGQPVVLDARDVTVTFELPAPFLRPAPLFTAVDKVSLTLRRGQTLGIVGESGSGKSTLGRAVLKLLPSTGAIRFEDRALAPLSKQQMRPLRSAMQLVFQDPFGSLSPRLTVGQIVTEGLLVHQPQLSGSDRDRRAAAALAEVEIEPALRNRYPHEFSGGQRQRIAIARAMILSPKLVVLDEPTSALDRSVQKAIIELLRRMQDEKGLSYLFISHDLAVVRAMADDVMVMKEGRVVERGPRDRIFADPAEDYTRRLIAAAFMTANAA
jgi:oligopeptide transport system ATP-binding protein